MEFSGSVEPSDSAATGRLSMSPDRRTRHTSVSFWLNPRCSKRTIPVSGRDFDSRRERISVSTRRVSPMRTVAGKAISSNPRLPRVVPRVVSWTGMPTTRPRVKTLLTMRSPYMLCFANSVSRCSGCTFIVRVVKSRLSVSVTVRVTPWVIVSSGSRSSKYRPVMGNSFDRALVRGDGVGEGDDVAGRLDVGDVDVFALEQGGGAAVGRGLLKGGDHPAEPVDHLRVRGVDLVDGGDMGGMDEHLTGESETAVRLGEGAQTVEVGDLLPQPHDGMSESGRPARQHRPAAVVQRLEALRGPL